MKDNDNNFGWDLNACLEYNDIGYTPADFKRVVANFEGEKDEHDWFWIVELKERKPEGKYLFIQGGCDYTGWDCQSSANCELAKSKRAAVKLAWPKDDSSWSSEWSKKAYYSMLEQIKSSQRKPTWKEEKDKEFKGILGDVPKIYPVKGDADVPQTPKDKVLEFDDKIMALSREATENGNLSLASNLIIVGSFALFGEPLSRVLLTGYMIPAQNFLTTLSNMVRKIPGDTTNEEKQ